MSGDTGDDPEDDASDGDVHGFEHAPFELEIGAIELDPASGEIPIVVINSRQPHYQALRAIKAWRERWRERLVLPAPLLTLIDLFKEYPLGTAIGAGTAAVVTATSIAATAHSPSTPPSETTIISEHLEGVRMSSSATQLVSDHVSTIPAVPPTSAGPTLLPRPSTTPASTSHAKPTPTPAPMPKPASSPTLSRRPQTTAPPPVAPDATPPKQEEPTSRAVESSQAPTPPSPPSEASPQKPTLLPPIDVDVPLIDEDPLVEGVCELLPIGCPIG